MKNKVLFALIIPLLSCSLIGCSKQDERVLLTYGTEIQQNLVTLKEVNNDELYDKAFNEKEVFLLAVYQGGYSEDCLCWSTYQDVIVNYMNSNHELVYVYDAQKQDDSLKDLKITKYEDSAPSLYIFKGQEQITSFTYKKSQDKAIFEDRKGEAMKERVHKYANKPLLYYVSLEFVLDNKSTHHKSIAVLYVRRGCGDCKYVLPNVVIPYINSNNNVNPIYIVDLQDLYDLQNKGETSGMPYDAIKNRLELTESSNKTFGYRGGVVPTIQYYEKGVLSDASVFFNDEVSQKEDGSYYISDSFYSEERLTSIKYAKYIDNNVLKGMDINKEDVITTATGYTYWSQEKAAKYHAPLFQSFIEYYCSFILPANNS